MREQCEQILDKYHAERGSVISILQDVQDTFGYIPEDVVFLLSERLNIPASSFYGAATFYSQFFLKPRGKNVITACCGTACHIKGAGSIIGKIRTDLGLSGDEETTEDGLFTMDSVACVGACGIAPVVLINKKVYGNMTPEKTSKALKEIKDEMPEHGRQESK